MTNVEDRLRDQVREKYAEIASTGGCGCGPSCCGAPDGIDMIGDAYENVAGHMDEADLGLGCGLPVEHAGIKPGDTVLDLGSGAGNDVFIARHEAGAAGHIIGVDMTPEMIGKARANAAKLGHDNVEFRLGEIEHLPVETGSVDVVISNCVLNLVPDKRVAFAEIHRVLKPGGRFCISDTVASAPLPAWTQEIAALYVGCVSGALPRDEYLSIIAESGFRNTDVVKAQRVDVPENVLADYADADELADARARDLHLLSITVTGTKD